MGRIIPRGKLIEFVKKYRYVLLVFAVGLFLMLLPSGKTNSNKEADIIVSQNNILSVEEQLGSILSQVRGAGEVQVMLTQANGEETLYQTNEDFSDAGDSNTTRIDTVTITDADRNETGLVRQVNPPTYQGAIIVCQGADSPTVRLAIIEAVSKVTGLGADKISVLKMK